MRVALIAEHFPAVSETFILRQITGLIELGHEVDIYAERRPENPGTVHPEVEKFGLLSRTTYMDIPPDSGYWEMPVWPITGETWLPGAEHPISNARRVLHALPVLFQCAVRAPGLLQQVLNSSEYGYRAESLSAVYRLARLCRVRHRYDVIHAHFGPIGDSFRFARQLWRAPLVVSFHGYDFSRWPRENGRAVYKKLFASADAVTVNSDHTCRRVADLGCPFGKMHKLHVGVDLRQFTFAARQAPTDRIVRVLTVARLASQKGIEYAIRAIELVKRQFPAIHYDIIGAGPLEDTLKKLASEINIADAVSFHGAQSGTFVQGAMRKAHIFMLTSVTIDGDTEGQGLVLQEAQACGLPVIATDHGPFPEGILPGRSGYLVPERDPEALARALLDLVRHPETWEALGRAGREHVEKNYNVQNLNRDLAELYANIAGRVK